MFRLSIQCTVALIVTLTLLISAVSIAQNTFETAEQLPLDETLCFTVMDSGNEYWWEVTTSEAGSLVITTRTDAAIDYAVYIYDDSNTELDKDTEAGSETSIQLDNVTEGTYYILIERTDGAGDMTISTEFSAG